MKKVIFEDVKVVETVDVIACNGLEKYYGVEIACANGKLILGYNHTSSGYVLLDPYNHFYIAKDFSILKLYTSDVLKRITEIYPNCSIYEFDTCKELMSWYCL